MATIDVLTAERTIEIEDAIIVSAVVNGSGHLILTRNDASTVDAGLVKGTNGTNGTNGSAGAKGDTGTAGTNGTNGTNGASGAISVTALEDVPGGTAAGTPIFLHS